MAKFLDARVYTGMADFMDALADWRQCVERVQIRMETDDVSTYLTAQASLFHGLDLYVELPADRADELMAELVRRCRNLGIEPVIGQPIYLPTL